MTKAKTGTSKSRSGQNEKAKSFSFSIPLEPVPASRPRVSKWGTYHAKPYKNWLESAADFLQGVSPPFDKGDHISAQVEIVCTRAATSKLTRPKGDIDNYVKATLDAINHAEGYWEDDVQVTALTARKRFAKPGEAAGTHVTLTLIPH